MEAYYQVPVQNSQWYNNSKAYRKSTQRKAKRCATVPRGARAMLIIDGAYFEQGTSAYLSSRFGIDLFESSTPEVLMQNFIETIEEWLNVQCIHRHFITSLFDDTQGTKILRDNQNAMIQTLENEWKFEIDWREFKNMSVYCPNKSCFNSKRPINRKVQAEVDVAIATRALSLAFKDEYDMLIAITGDRDFKDCFWAIATEAHKQVKICGFEQSIWQGYYDPGYGWEVFQAEYVWDRAIGKSLTFDSKSQSKDKSENLKYQESPNSYEDNNYSRPKRRYEGYSNTRSESEYTNLNKQRKRRLKNKKKIVSWKITKINIDNVLNRSKSTSNLVVSQAKYFDHVSIKSKEKIISIHKVDAFTAELALFITDGDEEKCKAFLNTR